MYIKRLIVTIFALLIVIGGAGAYVDASNSESRRLALDSFGGNTSVVLAIDTSDSMYGVPLESAKEAARVFIQNLNPATPVAVVTFSSRAELVHDFSSDHNSLVEAIDELATGGVTALYDGSLLAVETASKASASQSIVVLLSDGAEYGGQSSALRTDAREEAVENDVMVFTIGLGFGADRTFLEEMVDDGVGEMFEAPTPDELLNIYSELGERVAAEAEEAQDAGNMLERASADGNATGMIPAVQADAASAAPNATANRPVRSGQDVLTSGTQVSASNAQTDTPMPLVETADDTGADITASIPAVEDGMLAMILDDAVVESAREEVSVPNPIVRSESESETTAAEAAGEEVVADVLDSGVVPITIEVESPDLIETAELAVNGYSLAVYDTAPYTYELDLSRLEQGLYNLSFMVSYQSGSAAMGKKEFNVVEVVTEGGATLMETEIDGVQSSDLVFNFSPEAGLAFVQQEERILSDTPTAQFETMSLMSILSRPVAEVLPPGLAEAISKPRPVAASIVVLVMTITLLPQGVFTLVWMLYTWNNPEAAEEYASPTDYEEPMYKFTALVPARKEEEVIYETVMKVDAIDYPEHLKEVLVLVRDEDDDGTIAEVNRAIADLGHKPSIRLITFTDGPYNKPNGLNRGFDQGTGDVYCIFDAEDHPNQEIYNIVNTTMIRENADVVQSGVQLMTHFGQHGKEPWFAALNVLEYFFWFKSGLHCFTREFNVTPLGGNTVFAKQDWLETIGMRHNRWDEGHRILEVWDEKCLTEDADLGIRLTNAGANIQIVYSAEHATQEETPASVEQFVKQRTRWMQGFYEVFRKGDWLGMPKMKQKIVGLYILLNSLLQASLVLFLPVGIFIALTQEIPVPLAIISWIPIYLLLLQMITQLVGIREYAEAYGINLPRGYRLKMILYYYPYQLMLAVSAARAVGRFVRGTNNWEKTAHSGAHRNASPAARPVATA